MKTFFQGYKEAVIASKIASRFEDGELCLFAELPNGVESAMTHVFAGGGNFYTSPVTTPAKAGDACIAHIVFPEAQLSAVQALEGYLGVGNAVTQTAQYQSIVGSTDPIWVFLVPDYQQY